MALDEYGQCLKTVKTSEERKLVDLEESGN